MALTRPSPIGREIQGFSKKKILRKNTKLKSPLYGVEETEGVREWEKKKLFVTSELYSSRGR